MRTPVLLNMALKPLLNKGIANMGQGGHIVKKYIGCRMFEVEPMTRGDYNAYRGWSVPADENPLDEGYLTKDPDGHVSWLPKNTFEKAYMKLEDNPELPSGVSIGQKMVDEFIAYTETKTMGTKTTVVRCVLRNGFEIVESTGCVDEKNYSEKIGYEICMERIKNKIWELLGFLLQMAWNGIQ